MYGLFENEISTQKKREELGESRGGGFHHTQREREREREGETRSHPHPLHPQSRCPHSSTRTRTPLARIHAAEKASPPILGLTSSASFSHFAACNNRTQSRITIQVKILPNKGIIPARAKQLEQKTCSPPRRKPLPFGSVV